MEKSNYASQLAVGSRQYPRLKTGTIMRQAVLGGLAIFALLIATPLNTVFAADMAVPAPAPVVYSDWTGLYFDVGAGWQYDRFNWTFVDFAAPVSSMSTGQGSITGHMGYQQQFGWLVVGGEVGAFKSLNGNPASTPPTGACNVITVGSVCQASVTSTSLAGGKVGVDWQNWLFYGVGGVAFNSGIASHFIIPIGSSDSGGQQNTKGWYWGAGLDYLLLKTNFGDLIGGVEYEHVNLSTLTECSTNAGPGIAGHCPDGIGSASRAISASEDGVWAKLTLKFNPFN